MEKRIAHAAPAIEAGRLALENVHDAIDQLVYAQDCLCTASNQAIRGSNLANNIQETIRCVDKAKRRIHSLTRLARFSELRKTKVPLKEFLTTIVGQAENEAAKSRVSITVTCPADLVVRIDADKLQRVFSNFLTNALWFLERDTKGVSKEIRITGTRESDCILIRFHDNGPGIEASALPRIFDYFFTTRVGQGMGLGLSIARQIIELHGGTLSAISRWGYYTEMSVRLAIADAI
jgi:signal transduction histidine kinase